MHGISLTISLTTITLIGLSPICLVPAAIAALVLAILLTTLAGNGIAFRGGVGEEEEVGEEEGELS